MFARRSISKARVLWPLLALMALVLVATAYASSVNYYGPAAMSSGSAAATPGVAPRQWNKVYRPVYGCNPGSKFALYYTDMGSVYNWCSNPFTDTRSDPNYVTAWCRNWDELGRTADPTTCVTTKPDVYFALSSRVRSSVGGHSGPIEPRGISALNGARGLSPNERFGSKMNIAEVAALLTAEDPAVTGSAPEALLPGQARLDAGTVLRQGLGARARTLIAFPTEKGNVCYSLSGVAAGCSANLSSAAPVDVVVGKPDLEPLGSGEGVAVWGIATDSVVGVNVVVHGATLPASLVRNAFYYQITNSSVAPEAVEALVVELNDGSTGRVNLK